MTHTLYWWTGFEDQQPSRGFTTIGTAPTFDSSITSLSRYSAKWDGSAAGVTGELQMLNILSDGLWGAGGGGGLDFVTTALHLYISALPISGQYIYLQALDRQGGFIKACRVTDAGKLEVFNDNGSTWATSANALSTGIWYVVSWESRRNGVLSAVARLRDTGATIASVTHGTASGNSTTLGIRLGPYSSSRGTWYIDNYVIEFDSVAGNVDDPVNLLGTRYAVGLPAMTGNGFYTGWSGTYTDVDDYPHDTDATYRSAATVVAFTSVFAPTSSLAAQVAIVHGLLAFGFVRQEAGTPGFAIRVRSGTTDSTGTAFGVGSSYTVCHWRLLTDPATSSSWSVSGIDAVQAGFVRTGGTSAARCTNVGYELLYSVGAITRTKVVAYMMDDFDPEQRVIDARTGEELPHEEIQPNVGWLRVTSGEMPDSNSPEDAWEDETLLPIDSVRFSQDASGTTLDIIPSSEG